MRKKRKKKQVEAYDFQAKWENHIFCKFQTQINWEKSWFLHDRKLSYSLNKN